MGPLNYQKFKDGKETPWDPQVLQLAKASEAIDETKFEERDAMYDTLNAPQIQH